MIGEKVVDNMFPFPIIPKHIKLNELKSLYKEKEIL